MNGTDSEEKRQEKISASRTSHRKSFSFSLFGLIDRVVLLEE